MAQVVQNTYVAQLAHQNHVSISSQTVNNEVTLLKNQNRLGSNTRVFDDVLDEFWGWNEADFKRELKTQLLQQAVVAKLDTATNARAQAALKQLVAGANFATFAGQVSDDASTKAAGGQYANAITINDSSIPPIITQALFSLKPGQTSTIINAGYTLEILKVISQTGDSLQAAHIQFTFQPITDYTKPLQAKEPVHQYIKL
jgi:parvulin-like peptidyl-prolyl isomerase